MTTGNRLILLNIETMTNQYLAMTFSKWSLLFFVCIFSSQINAQLCAGTDGSIYVCNKDLDNANETFALFPILEGSPVSGGTWSTNDPANFFALNRATGIVNLWEVKNSGIHEFTYTNSACGESAIILISLGGYGHSN